MATASSSPSPSAPTVPTPAQAAPQAFAQPVSAPDPGAASVPVPAPDPSAAVATVTPGTAPSQPLPVSVSTPIGDVSYDLNPFTNPWALAGLAVSLTAAAACAYHGYKRNDGAAGWGVLWGLGGFFAPPLVLATFVQGYAEPSDGVRLKHIELAMKQLGPKVAEQFNYAYLSADAG